MPQHIRRHRLNMVRRYEFIPVKPCPRTRAPRQCYGGARRGAEAAPALEVGIVGTRLAAGLNQIHDVVVKLGIEIEFCGILAHPEEILLG
jgi:hypothetical protein